MDLLCTNPKIYFSVCTNLLYGHTWNIAWSPHYAKDKVLLEKMQHRFTRMIVGMKELPYEERLRRLGLWTLEERRVCADLIEVHRMSKGLSKVKFDYFFEYATDSRTRGHHLKLKKEEFT